MKTSIRKIGNAYGVLIPKALLVQLGMELGEVELEIENDAIVIRKPQKAVREKWANASKEIAANGDDVPAWPEFANEDDDKLTW